MKPAVIIIACASICATVVLSVVLAFFVGIIVGIRGNDDLSAQIRLAVREELGREPRNVYYEYVPSEPSIEPPPTELPTVYPKREVDSRGDSPPSVHIPNLEVDEDGNVLEIDENGKVIREVE